jgi:hypothetical protein
MNALAEVIVIMLTIVAVISSLCRMFRIALKSILQTVSR